MKLWNPAASGHLHDLKNKPWPAYPAPISSHTSSIARQDEQVFNATSGATELDQLHVDLIDLLAALSVCVDNEFAACYRRLIDKVEVAFRYEEERMEETGYADIPSHCEEHARVLCALHKVHAEVMIGKLDQGRRVAEELLPQWFSLHFTTLDTDLAQAIQRRNAQMLMPPR